MTKKIKVRKIKYMNVLLFLIIIFLFIYLLVNILDLRITNIFILNNNILKDQEIIELAGISDYPSTLSSLSKRIEKNLEKNVYIKECKVYKKKLTHIYIDVIENYPVFYDKTSDLYVLSDGQTVNEYFNVPTLINYVPDSIYKLFVEKMAGVNSNILSRISEIEYKPNNVDEERFLLTMNDGNLIYLTLSKFNNVNDYINIVKKFNNSKGILYLDSGEYFEKVY